MQISIEHDIAKAKKALKRQQKKQVPYATSLALNSLAADGKAAVDAQLPKKLDRPTSFTLKAVGIQYAKKNKLTSTVLIKDAQAKYLQYQIKGGTRRFEGGGTGVPTSNKKLNKFGNIPGRRKGLIKNHKQFIDTIDGVLGVWERHGRGGRQVRLLIRIEKEVSYKPRLKFHAIVQGVVKHNFDRRFSQALKKALATAR